MCTVAGARAADKDKVDTGNFSPMPVSLGGATVDVSGVGLIWLLSFNSLSDKNAFQLCISHLICKSNGELPVHLRFVGLTPFFLPYTLACYLLL